MKRISPRYMRGFFLLMAICGGLGISACATDTDGNSRLSSAVAVLYKSPPAAAWLSDPDALSYIEAYVSFPPDTGSDVIFGIDQEFFDGIQKPYFYKGGDWMGLVGLQRNGKIWIAEGTDGTMKGKPSANRSWEVIQLERELQPNNWYHIRTVIDFKTRHYVSFTINGLNLNRTVDLKEFTLDYPNYLPFEQRLVGNFVFAMRGKSLMTEPVSGAVAYFANINSGLVSPEGKDEPLFGDNLKSDGDKIPSMDIPFTAFLGGSIPMEPIREGVWYRERAASRVRVLQVPGAKNGEKVLKCDATLQPVSYDDWFNGVGSFFHDAPAKQ